MFIPVYRFDHGHPHFVQILLLTNLLSVTMAYHNIRGDQNFQGRTVLVGLFWLDASGGTKIFRVGPDLPEILVPGPIFPGPKFQ